MKPIIATLGSLLAALGFVAVSAGFSLRDSAPVRASLDILAAILIAIAIAAIMVGFVEDALRDWRDRKGDG